MCQKDSGSLEELPNTIPLAGLYKAGSRALIPRGAYLRRGANSRIYGNWRELNFAK